MTDQISYQDRYQDWLKQLVDSDPLKEELTSLCEDSGQADCAARSAQGRTA